MEKNWGDTPSATLILDVKKEKKNNTSLSCSCKYSIVKEKNI